MFYISKNVEKVSFDSIFMKTVVHIVFKVSYIVYFEFRKNVMGVHHFTFETPESQKRQVDYSKVLSGTDITFIGLYIASRRM